MASTYSIWIEPQGATADQLQQEINYLADAYGGPTFPPHVTLVGGVTGNEDQVLESAQDLAAKLKPYRISFDKPEYGGIYHQCVYMLCQKEQSTMRAGKQSKDVFKQSLSAYMPHLSLLYSDIDEHVRKQAVEVVRSRLESKGADMLQADGFDVHSIHVYRTDPEDKLCKTWKRIKELELTSK